VGAYETGIAAFVVIPNPLTSLILVQWKPAFLVKRLDVASNLIQSGGSAGRGEQKPAPLERSRAEQTWTERHRYKPLSHLPPASLSHLNPNFLSYIHYHSRSLRSCGADVSSTIDSVLPTDERSSESIRPTIRYSEDKVTATIATKYHPRNDSSERHREKVVKAS